MAEHPHPEQAHATAVPFQPRPGSKGKWDALTRVVLPEGLEQSSLVKHLYFLILRIYLCLLMMIFLAW